MVVTAVSTFAFSAIGHMWHNRGPSGLLVPHWRPMQLAEAVDQYLRHLEHERGCTPRTLVSYRQELDQLRRVLEAQGIRALGSIERSHLVAYINRPAPGGALLSSGTRNRKLTVLRSLFGFLVKAGHAAKDANPALGIAWSRERRRERPTLTPSDVGRILQAAGKQGSTWRRIRDQCLISVLYNTGLRLAELVGLNLEQVDLVEGLLLGVLRKGGNHQPLPINRHAAKVFGKWLDARAELNPPTAAVFITDRGERISRSAVQARLRLLGKEAGLPFRVTPHGFRHAWVTAMLEAGANLAVVQQLAGHTSIGTTSRYAHPTVDAQRAALERLPAPKPPKQPKKT